MEGASPSVPAGSHRRGDLPPKVTHSCQLTLIQRRASMMRPPVNSEVTAKNLLLAMAIIDPP